MTHTVQISSLLVSARPDTVPAVVQAISDMPIAEVADFGRHGKIIVVLETPDESEIVQALTDIQLIPGVASAALVYHQADTAEPPDIFTS